MDYILLDEKWFSVMKEIVFLFQEKLHRIELLNRLAQ